MLKANRVPKIPINACQNYPVKRGSRSLTIVTGTPKSLTILSKKRRATSPALRSSPILQGVIRTSFVNRSTQVNTALKPPEDGRCVMKSMDQDSNRPAGTGRGYSSPAGALVESFVRWHTGQAPTYSRTTRSMRGHQTRAYNARRVLRTPRCPAIRLSCSSYIKTSRIPPVLGITRRSPYGRTWYNNYMSP